jgi:hypothetical protein
VSKNGKYYWKTQHSSTQEVQVTSTTIKDTGLLRFPRVVVCQKKYDWIEFDDGIYINMYRGRISNIVSCVRVEGISKPFYVRDVYQDAEDSDCCSFEMLH